MLCKIEQKFSKKTKHEKGIIINIYIYTYIDKTQPSKAYKLQNVKL